MVFVDGSGGVLRSVPCQPIATAAGNDPRLSLCIASPGLGSFISPRLLRPSQSLLALDGPKGVRRGSLWFLLLANAWGTHLGLGQFSRRALFSNVAGQDEMLPL